MVTRCEVILLEIGVLFAFLVAIYLFSIGNNGQKNVTDKKGKRDNKISFEEEENIIKTPKKNKEKTKENVLSEKQRLSLVSAIEASEVIDKFDEEYDIIALASLKDCDTAEIHRRLPEKAKKIESAATIETKKFNSKFPEIEKENSVVKIEEIFTISEEIKFNQEVLSESVSNLTIEEWSHVPTLEEEVIKNLKNKLTVLEAEIEESELKLMHNLHALQQSEKRINLVERELKEQRKMSTRAKATMEAQVASFRAINKEMAGKLMAVEADALNASLLKFEFDRSKEAISLLQTDFLRAQEEISELFRQISELKIDKNKSKAEEIEKSNLQLLCRIEEFESKDFESIETLKRSEEIIQIKNEGISKLEIDLETSKSKLIAYESEISFLNSAIKSYEHADAEAANSDENISNLRNQLTREIKRVNIAKKSL
jgi:hypothetical protein